MKHVKLATRPAPVKAQVVDPYSEKKDNALSIVCLDGFTKV